MSNASVVRRKPCRNCGGRYYASTMGVIPALIATAAFLGGIAMTVIGSGFLPSLQSGNVPDVEGIFSHLGWAIGGVVVAGIIAGIGHQYRCVGCDRPR